MIHEEPVNEQQPRCPYCQSTDVWASQRLRMPRGFVWVMRCVCRAEWEMGA